MGHPEIRLLYLTPESLFSAKYKDVLEKAYKQGQIRRLVVDEVGCRLTRYYMTYSVSQAHVIDVSNE